MSAPKVKMPRTPTGWFKTCGRHGHRWSMTYRPFEAKGIRSLNFQYCERCNEVRWV